MSGWDGVGGGGGWGDSGGGGGGARRGGGGARRGGGGRDAEVASYQNADRDYLRSCESIRKDITRFDNLINNVKQRSGQIGTRADTREMRAKMRADVENGRKMMQSLTTRLSDFRRFMTGLTRTEEEARKQQQNRFIKDFSSRAQTFKKVAQAALEAEQRVVHTARTSMASGGGASDGSDDDTEALMGLRAQGQMVEFNEDLIAEREEEITRIQGTVVEVNEVFQDLARLVDEQGRDIDNIEFNVTEAEERTKGGVGHLNEAEKLAKKARNRTLCILALIFICAGALTLWLMMTGKH